MFKNKKLNLILILSFLNNLLVNTNEEERKFSFHTEDQIRQENWRSNGTATGFFGWTDVNGEGLDIEFIADENGYRVIKKKNMLSVFEATGRNPRDREDAEEFEFDADEFADAYSFRYDTGSSFREESKRGGVVFGKYGHLTPHGKLLVVRYTASRKRGYVPIKEMRDAGDYSSIASEPISPLPLRRMRELAPPPKLWPIENSFVTENLFVDSTTVAELAPDINLEMNVDNITINNTTNVDELSSVTSTTTLTPLITTEEAKPTFHSKTPEMNKLITRESRAQNEKGINQFSYNVSRQFHKQDQVDNSSVRGQYGWRDATGVMRVVHYVADTNGFKVFKKEQS